MQAERGTSDAPAHFRTGAQHVRRAQSPIHLSVKHQQQVKSLLQQAIAGPTGPSASYIESSGKEFECINHDIYDVLMFRGKVKAIVVQERWFWKHTRKGYTRQSKEYFLIIRNQGSCASKKLTAGRA